jgi:DNA-binding TFAR19-related protein (PDSD5 family)
MLETERRGIDINFKAPEDSQAEQNRQEVLAGIMNSDVRERLKKILEKINNRRELDPQVAQRAVKELVSVGDVPPRLAEMVVIRRDSGISSEDIDRYRIGEVALERFMDASSKPYNLFHFDRNLPADELAARQEDLEELYALYQEAPLVDRTKIEELTIDACSVPEIPSDVQTYLDQIRKDLPEDKKPGGAENVNLILTDSLARQKVLKMSKDRHEADFSSVLWLMRNMYAFSKRFNGNQAELLFNDMKIYRDYEGKYKRLVRQDFAAGSAIKDLNPEIKEDPEFLTAWQSFLGKIEEMKETDGVVLDISDSEAGMREVRGDVTNTGNVFVERVNGEYRFSVIDPDVFDAAKDGQEKFDPKEYIRKHGLRGIGKALAMYATNIARRELVLAWQDKYVQFELARKAHNSVEEVERDQAA